MNFVQDYIKYNREKHRKQDLKEFIKENNIFFGSGGSENIIIKVDEQKVIKIIPNFKKDPNSKELFDNDKKEIEFYKFFYQHFIKKNITPHIVGYYDNYTLLNITKIFPKKCMTIEQKLLTKPEKINNVVDKLCQLKNLHDYHLINDTADIIVLENCPNTIAREIYSILASKNKNKYEHLKDFLDRIIFQLIYTLTSIQHSYPTFIHNDLFLRNILGKNEDKYSDNEYVEYIYNNVSYYLPANGFYLKINDFGYSLLPPIIMSKVYYKNLVFNPTKEMVYDDNLRDIYTFLYDLYNGENFGHPSVMAMIGNVSQKIIDDMRNYFSKYLNINIIDKIIKNNKQLLDRQWNIKFIPILRKTVMEPKKYFEKGKFKQYKYLPNDAVIVKTFQIN